MKTGIYLFIFTLFFSFNAIYGQQKNYDAYLDQLPKNLKLDKSVKQTFQMTTDYMDYDLKGNFIRKTRVSGIYTCGLKNDQVKWNDIYISRSNQLGGTFPPGIKRIDMENFSYIPNEKILEASFFDQIPNADFLIKNLIWDTFGFEGFASWYWDSLQLNVDYLATELNSSVDLAGQGTFENKDFIFKWIGITKMNNEICAIIKYSTMNNPLEIELDNFLMTGRSHYWGEVYVSLEDKQLEYANLTEDVLTDIKIPSQPNNVLGYTVRHITFAKINKTEKR